MIQTALGFDPGLANFGWGVVDITAVMHGEGPPLITSLGTWRTEKRPGPVNKDITRRVQTFALHVDKLIDDEDPVLMCSEEVGRMPQASTTGKVNKCAGAPPILAVVREVEFEEVSALRIKKHLTGANAADKQSIEQFLMSYCTDEALRRLEEDLPRAKSKAIHGLRSHAFDACGAVFATLAERGLWTRPVTPRRRFS